MFELSLCERFDMAFKPGVSEVTIDGVTVSIKFVRDEIYFRCGNTEVQVVRDGYYGDIGAREDALHELLTFR